MNLWEQLHSLGRQIAALEHAAARLKELHHTLYLRVARAEGDITVWRAQHVSPATKELGRNNGIQEGQIR